MRLLKVFRAVLWSLVGIRKGANAELRGVRPSTLIVVALLVAATVVGSIAALVRFITPDKLAARVAPATSAPPAPLKPNGPVVVRDTMQARVAPCLHCHTGTTEPTRDGFSPRIAG